MWQGERVGAVGRGCLHLPYMLCETDGNTGGAKVSQGEASPRMHACHGVIRTGLAQSQVV